MKGIRPPEFTGLVSSFYWWRRRRFLGKPDKPGQYFQTWWLNQHLLLIELVSHLSKRGLW